MRVSQQSEARLLLDTLCSHYFHKVAGGSSSRLPSRAAGVPCLVESGREKIFGLVERKGVIIFFGRFYFIFLWYHLFILKLHP